MRCGGGGGQPRAPCHGLADSAPEVAVPGFQAEEGCLGLGPAAFPTYFKVAHEAEYILGRSEVLRRFSGACEP